LRHRNPVILVTGVNAGCGTSFLARNLAVSIAFDEARTAILMDCNLRRPTVAANFLLPDKSKGSWTCSAMATRIQPTSFTTAVCRA
jgi:protein-tyrosine kinase